MDHPAVQSTTGFPASSAAENAVPSRVFALNRSVSGTCTGAAGAPLAGTPDDSGAAVPTGTTASVADRAGSSPAAQPAAANRTPTSTAAASRPGGRRSGRFLRYDRIGVSSRW
ncbi:hypothetical protein [Micromonospora halophytica]|uniref:hypothetical protein n=1 Tax=Micromonospora halophytica TaxID=47864 RepID=UPI0011130237|nr:hypothetical protein [Micromonospora halophytica]